MESRMFDEVTKALATPNSRRQALRRIAGILGGTALVGLVPGVALADNSACAHWCNSIFEGSDRGQCKSDAAHGTGLCYTCGPASPNGTQPICCPTNPDGTCTSYSSATCCSGGQTCQSGACVAGCPAGQVQLSNGTCALPCVGEFSLCCYGTCEPDADHTHFYCTNEEGSYTPCTSDAGCPTGEFCDILGGGSGVCHTAITC